MKWQTIDARTQEATLAMTREAFFLALADPTFALNLSRELAAREFEAFRWECPPLVDEERPASFVVVDAPHLRSIQPTPETFDEHYGGASPAVRFWNIGKNAELVVPQPRNGRDYGHLARFVRAADDDELIALWREVGIAAMSSEVRPLWISTAGGGVSWLHVRLDKRPKYYAHQVYRDPAS